MVKDEKRHLMTPSSVLAMGSSRSSIIVCGSSRRYPSG
jgi:hypothetical protein